ncbi:MAG: hypothetical protein Q8917_14390, partial [Bacillota bacterium]|nr:hypothetical protein [Bacillota bacterium]
MLEMINSIGAVAGFAGFIGIIILMYSKSVNISIGCGYDHTMLLIDGICYVWGRNNHGQLGLGDLLDYDTPQKLDLLDIKSINCGGYNTFALTKLNEVYAWGNNNYGQLGLGDIVNYNTPQKLNLSNITSISCGEQHTFAI